jgi:DNA repair protein RecO (recombination protein O)
MTLLVTDAIVLHGFEYMETSRILRLATREGGVQSVIARGTRRPKSRWGGSLDLFTEGRAQISIRPTRELQTLTTFDAIHPRPELAMDLSRFTGASAISELTLRFAHEDVQPAVYDSLVATLDGLARSEPMRAREIVLAGAWRLIGELGFAPALEQCSECHTPLAPDEAVRFSHRSGGALCARCARTAAPGRTLPAEARRVLLGWLQGEEHLLDDAAIRAHQRLLREFLLEHLADGRALRAFDVWERAEWDQPAA